MIIVTVPRPCFFLPRIESDNVRADGRWHPVVLEFLPDPACDFWTLFLKVTGVGSVRFSDFDYVVEGSEM